MINFLIIIEILIVKILKINISFIKREISGYPQIVQKFETEFSNYIGKKYGLTFCNGTSSIEAAIYALNLHKEDQILTTSSNFHASIGPIKNLGHKIVFVDIDKDTLTIDCDDLEKKINHKTKALLIVHPWGYPCDMEKIVNIVKKYNLKLIEDCSHSHGALFENKKVGSFADISCFSLQGSKAIKAGEGGIAITDNQNYFFKMSIYGHFNRHSDEFKEIKDLNFFKDTGLSKKLRAHPLGITLAYTDFKNLEKLNKIKNKIYKKLEHIIEMYETLKIMKTNKNSVKGGFFGGFPIIFTNNNNIELILKIFKKFNLSLKKYPWLSHHKLKIYAADENILKVTENIEDKLYLLQIPYFLNINYSNLKNCLDECKKKKLL